MHGAIDTVLFTEDEIRARVRQLGEAITLDTAGHDLVLLGLLKGSVIFFADLMRSVGNPLHVDFAWVSSYGAGTTSSENVELKVFPDEDLKGRTVVVVDDILDTGRTLATVCERLRQDLGARDVKTCVLLDKAARRVVTVKADYVGFPVDDVFVVGYGLDHADRYRNLPYIGVLKEQYYRSDAGA